MTKKRTMEQLRERTENSIREWKLLLVRFQDLLLKNALRKQSFEQMSRTEFMDFEFRAHCCILAHETEEVIVGIIADIRNARENKKQCEKLLAEI